MGCCFFVVVKNFQITYKSRRNVFVLQKLYRKWLDQIAHDLREQGPAKGFVATSYVVARLMWKRLWIKTLSHFWCVAEKVWASIFDSEKIIGFAFWDFYFFLVTENNTLLFWINNTLKEDPLGRKKNRVLSVICLEKVGCYLLSTPKK